MPVSVPFAKTPAVSPAVTVPTVTVGVAPVAPRTGIALLPTSPFALWTGRAGREGRNQRYAGIGFICQNARCTGSYRSNGYGGCSTGCALRTGITPFAL